MNTTRLRQLNEDNNAVADKALLRMLMQLENDDTIVASDGKAFAEQFVKQKHIRMEQLNEWDLILGQKANGLSNSLSEATKLYRNMRVAFAGKVSRPNRRKALSTFVDDFHKSVLARATEMGEEAHVVTSSTSFCFWMAIRCNSTSCGETKVNTVNPKSNDGGTQLRYYQDRIGSFKSGNGKTVYCRAVMDCYQALLDDMENLRPNKKNHSTKKQPQLSSPIVTSVTTHNVIDDVPIMMEGIFARSDPSSLAKTTKSNDNNIYSSSLTGGARSRISQNGGMYQQQQPNVDGLTTSQQQQQQQQQHHKQGSFDHDSRSVKSCSTSKFFEILFPEPSGRTRKTTDQKKRPDSKQQKEKYKRPCCGRCKCKRRRRKREERQKRCMKCKRCCQKREERQQHKLFNHGAPEPVKPQTGGPQQTHKSSLQSSGHLTNTTTTDRTTALDGNVQSTTGVEDAIINPNQIIRPLRSYGDDLLSLYTFELFQDHIM